MAVPQFEFFLIYFLTTAFFLGVNMSKGNKEKFSGD